MKMSQADTILSTVVNIITNPYIPTNLWKSAVIQKRKVPSNATKTEVLMFLEFFY